MGRGKNRAFSIAAAFSVSLLLLAGCGPKQFRADLFQANEMKGWGPEGLAWNGRDLVLGSERLITFHSAIEPASFVNVGSFYNSEGSYVYSRDPMVLTSSRPIQICGMAWEAGCCGDGYLWIANSLGRELLKVSQKNEIVASIPFPGEFPGGLAFDGKDLWAADSAKSRIYRIATDGTVLAEIPSPVTSPTGLAWDCEQLWVVGLESCRSATKDCNPARLMRVDPQTG